MHTIVKNALFAATSAALAIVTLSVPAHADTAEVLTRHADVHYSDLDLTNPADRATLRHRIHAAAYRVCTTDNDMAGRAASAACRKQAIISSAHQVDTVVAAAAASHRVASR